MEWIIVACIISYLLGVWTTIFAKKTKPSATFVIDCTDATKDVCTLELIENLNDTYTFTFNVTNDMGDNYLNVKFSCSVNNEEHLTLSSPTYMIDTQTAALDSAGFLVVKPGSTGIYSVTISAADNASNLENGFDDALYTFGLTVQRGAEYTV